MFAHHKNLRLTAGMMVVCMLATCTGCGQSKDRTVPQGGQQISEEKPSPLSVSQRNERESTLHETDPVSLKQKGKNHIKAVEINLPSKSSGLDSVGQVWIGPSRVFLYAQTPDLHAPFDRAGPWAYCVPVKLVKTDKPLFDSNSKTISVAFESPPKNVLDEELPKIKSEIVTFYKRQEPTNDKINSELVNVQGILLSGYEITVELGDKKILIKKKEPSEASIQFGVQGKQVFTSEPITDKEVINSLTHNPNSVTVRFRGYYGMNGSKITKVTVSATQEALSRVHESIKGVPGDFNIATLVTRDALLDAKKVVKSEIRTIIERDAETDPDIVAKLVDRAVNGIDKYFANLKPLTPADIDKATESFVVWITELARIEMQPDEFKKLTKALETKNSFETEWKKAYSLFTEAASHREGFQKFYNRLRNSLSTKGGAHGSLAGILSAGGDFSLSNDFDKLSAGEQKQVEDLYNKYIQGSLDEGKLRNAAYRKFAGEDWERSTRPKPLAVYRISAQSFSNTVRSEAVDIQKAGTVIIPQDYEDSASAASEGWQDTYSRLERLLRATDKNVEALQNEVNRLSQSALKVDFFEVGMWKQGSTPPKGYIQISDNEQHTEHWHPTPFGKKVIAVIPVITQHVRAVDSIRDFEGICKDNRAGIKARYWHDRENRHAIIRCYVLYQESTEGDKAGK